MLKSIRKKLTFMLAISMGITMGTAISNPVKVKAASTVNVNVSAPKQRISGFGASSAWCGALSDSVMDTLYKDIGLSILRVRMEPNEGWAWGDFRAWNDELSNARKAKARGAIVFATPWTAPASMKSNNSTTGTGGATLKQEKVGDYAKYLESYADYFANNGVPLYAISLQNEPDWTVDYDGCRWTGEQFRDFLKIYGPSLSKKAKIIMPESLSFNQAMSDPTLKDAEACKYASIVGGHLYGAQIKDYPLARQKGKELWMTELYETDQSLKGSMDFAKKIHDCLTVGNMSAYVYWWLNNTDVNSLIDRQNRPYHRAYIMGQFSKFIRYGYNRVDSTTNPQGNVYTSAYTGDNKVVIVAINQNTYPVNQTFNVQNKNLSSVSRWITSGSENMAKNSDVPSNNGSFTTSLPAQSVTTFVCSLSGSNNNTNVNQGTAVTKVNTGSYYRIKNANSGKYLSVPNNNSGAKTVQTSAVNESSIWQVVSGEDDGYVKLAAQIGDGRKVLDVTGASNDNAKQLNIWNVNGGANQDFKLKDNGDGTFGILTKLSGDTKGLDVYENSKEEGAPIIQYNYRASANQKWVFEQVNYTHPVVDGGVYYIKNLNSNLYLDVTNGSDANETNIRQWTGNGLDAQKFKAVSTGDGYFKLVAQVGDKNKVLDVSGRSGENGKNLILYTDKNADNQKFKFIDNGNGVFQIATKISGDKSLIEVANASKTRGANVQQWGNNSNNCQKWILEIVR